MDSKRIVNIAIVEDEKEMLDNLISCLKSFFVKLDQDFNFFSFNNAVTFLNTYKVGLYDLILMDINLPELNGMYAAKKLRTIDQDVLIVFVTYLGQYAIEGYKVNAFDYILKPLNEDSLRLTLKRALTKINIDENCIIISNSSQNLNKIKISEIKYVEVIGHNLMFHTVKGNFKGSGTIRKMTNELKGYSFVQCNISYLVNLKYISEINKDEVKVGDDILHISRPKRKEFLGAVNEYFSLGGGK